MSELQEIDVYRARTFPEIREIRLGYSWEEMVRLADCHTMTVQSWLSSRAPRARRFEGAGIRASSTGLGVALLNLALGSYFPALTPVREIDREIEAVKSFFARRGVPWSWWMGPFPQPHDMGQRLARHGLARRPSSLPAMVASLPTHFPATNPQIKVWQAASLADLKAASTIRRTAFRFPEGVALDYFEKMGSDWLRGDPARLYLARLGDGPPAAMGALIRGAGLPGVYIMATLPQWGRRGLGKAILSRILSQATAEGDRLIVLTASRFGFPLYRQFGFEHLFDYEIYRPVNAGGFSPRRR